jgi:hypothetical protein
MVWCDAEVRQMWVDGPSRRWSAVRTRAAQMPIPCGGYVGHYVCHECEQGVTGVYRLATGLKAAWLCSTSWTSHRAMAMQRAKVRTMTADASVEQGLTLPMPETSRQCVPRREWPSRDDATS